MKRATEEEFWEERLRKLRFSKQLGFLLLALTILNTLALGLILIQI